MKIREFKTRYENVKRVLTAIKKDKKYVGKYAEILKSRNIASRSQALHALSSLIENYEASIMMFYNVDGTINVKKFEKFYDHFEAANEQERALYASVNDMSYNDLVEHLDAINIKILNAQIEKFQRDMDQAQRENQKLIDLGIAKDHGSHLELDFCKYLEYLERKANDE